MNNFTFTLWDVEHGLSIWIQTPKEQNHCIDAGKNNVTEFSPYGHMRKYYNVQKLDALIISHPDKDHIEGLPELIKNIGEPRVLHRNTTLPDQEKYGDCQAEYLKIFKKLDTSYIKPVNEETSPFNPLFNGNVIVHYFYNSYKDVMNKNDTSIVMFYNFKNNLFIMPGDIEPNGWSILRKKYIEKIKSIIDGARTITLVAPHHGRPSAYSQEMIDDLSPNLILISDKYAKHETDSRYYSAGTGLYGHLYNERLNPISSDQIYSLSTKTKGRIKINIEYNGQYNINYDDKNFTLNL